MSRRQTSGRVGTTVNGEGVHVTWVTPNSNTVTAAGGSSFSMHWIGPA